MLVAALMGLLCNYTLQAQNVGIGTASPNQKLDVEGWLQLGDESTGTIGTPGAIRYNSGGFMEYHDGIAWRQFGSGWSLTGNAGTAPGPNFLGTTDANGLSIQTNSTEALRIDANQNIGVGTPTPDARLHLETSGGSVTTQVITHDIGTTGGGSDNSNLVIPPGATSVMITDIQIRGDFGIGGTTESFDFSIDGAAVLDNVSDGADDCTFDSPSEGSVVAPATGTLLPAPPSVDISALTVGNGTVNLETQVTAGVNFAPGGCTSFATVQYTVEISTGSPLFRLVDGNQQAGHVLTSDANGYASWQPAPSGSGADTDWTEGTGVVFNNTANIGIGVTAPSSELQVNGTLTIGDGANEYRMPTADGNNGDRLITDGNGNVSWERGLRVDAFQAFFPSSQFIINNGYVSVQALDGPRRIVITDQSGGDNLRVSYRVWDNNSTTVEANETLNLSATGFGGSPASVTVDDVSFKEFEILISRYSSVGDAYVVKIFGHGKANGWCEGILIEGDYP